MDQSTLPRPIARAEAPKAEATTLLRDLSEAGLDKLVTAVALLATVGIILLSPLG